VTVLKDKVFAPCKLGDLELRNRVIRTGAFEGMCPGGVPSDALIEHHRQMGAGGVGLTTVAYCSVSPDGRTYHHQMVLTEDIVPALKRLTDAVHREGAAASIQLGHCGDFANKQVIGGRPLGPSARFVLYGRCRSRAITPTEMQRVRDDFGRAAVLAREAGFDAVELHAGHGYLLSQFLSPFTNRRTDEHGGSLDNRLRFPSAVIRHVRERLGPGFPVLVKTNLRDGFAGGLEIDEAVRIAQRFEQDGAGGLVLSGGFVSKAPLYMLRGEVPVKEMAAVQESWLSRLGLRLFGRLFVQRYPYEELFFLDGARRVRAAVDLPLVLVGGVRSLAGMQTAMDEGFDLVALGRALIREPDLVRRFERGEAVESTCEPCNKCIAEMDRGGVRCALDD
jgi:2,4-dienoyl-CoA reductase-like NADH-dependent reductase (Old Yellow Enzyme family)